MIPAASRDIKYIVDYSVSNQTGGAVLHRNERLCDAAKRSAGTNKES